VYFLILLDVDMSMNLSAKLTIRPPLMAGSTWRDKREHNYRDRSSLYMYTKLTVYTFTCFI